MPKTILPKGQPYFLSWGHRLSNSAKKTLLGLLDGKIEVRRFDPARKPARDVAIVIDKIEAALGIYVDGNVHIDNPPRPADYVRTFEAIEGDARTLSETLFQINYHYDIELSNRGVDQNTIAVELLKLAEVSRAVIQEFQGKPSQGARTNAALVETICRLRAIFRSCFRGDANLTGGQRNRRENRFVKAALEDARIPCRDLGRIMRRSRSTPFRKQ